MTVLTCEKCDAKFEVPTKALIGGRKVRCTNCLHIWFEPDPAEKMLSKNPVSSDDNMDFAQMLERENEKDEVPDSIRPRTGSDEARVILTEDEETKKKATQTALIIGIALVLIVGIIGLAAQQHITKIFPAAETVYEASGLEMVNPAEIFRLDEGTATYQSIGAEGDDTLIIEARVTNIADQSYPLPTIRVDLVDIQDPDIVLQSWRPEINGITLAPGENHTLKWGFTDTAHKMGRIYIYFESF